MTAREIVGLVLVIVAIALVPFAYWVSFGWGLLAVLSFVSGVALFLSGRRARLSKQLLDLRVEPDIPPGHELRAFRSAAVLSSHDVAEVGDGDGGT